MKTRAVLFDLDGTLINSIPLIRLTFENVFEDMKIPWAGGEVLNTIGLPLVKVALHYAPGRAQEFLRRYSEFQKTRHDKLIKLFPGTLEMLGMVKAMGCLTGVVTSKRRAPALEGMAITGIDKFIEVAVTVEDVVNPKPSPEPVFKALELVGARPGEAYYVGDSWYDVQAGKQSGVTTLAVTWGMATREQLTEYQPDGIVDSWEELMEKMNGCT